MEFLENKSILITGATGFLAKIMVEKILRIQPNVKKLYLLLRTVDETTATQRFYNEVIEKDLFRVLKEKWRESLKTLISDKISLVPADISHFNLGLKDSNLLKEMKNQVEVIVHLAATTKFDERYDVALSTNTLGAKHVLGFAKQCCNLKVLVHVSTAYVSGEREGLILETPYEMGESLNGTTGLDIQTEQRVVEERLNELRKNGASDKTITLVMKDLGLQRAKMYGWPNTYVFTKAMGEMVVCHLKDNLPLVIIRPTIITSTYREPFPGWIEGVRTIDSFTVGYGKGKVQCFLCDTNLVVDVIPADMVVNTIIMSMVTHALEPYSTQMIYHVGSSARNSMRYIDFQRFTFQYFTKKPWINEDGKVIKVGKVTIFNNMASFRRYMTIRYLFFLKGLEFANKAFCHSFEDKYNDLKRKFNSVMRLVELYRPYVFFKAIFEDTNTERLRITAESKDKTKTLFLDPKDINWEDYFMNIHIPGVVKHVFK